MILELGPKLDKFIDRCMDTFTHWDLVVLLSQKRKVAESTAGIASQLGRRENEVKEALESLVKRNVVRREAKGGGYSLNPSYEEVVASFMEALKTREKRLMILTKVLEKGGR